MEKEAYRKKLSKFFEPLIFKYRVAREVKKHTDRYLASDFNLVEVMGPDENKISNIIAKLLNPNGEHGQGDVFLRKFLEVLENFVKPEWLSFENLALSQVKIEREHSTNNNRKIDIFLKFPEGVVAIENKLWAGEQEKQLEDYARYLEGMGDKFLLIYLDGLGRKAESIKQNLKEELKEKKKFIELSYGEFLLTWLRECLKECEADKVRWFLRDFISWIEENFEGEVKDERSEERGD